MDASAPTDLRGCSLSERLRRAVEQGDFRALAGLYAEDALLEEFSTLSPPSRPNVARGRDAILKRLVGDLGHDPVAGWTRHVRSTALLDEIETDEAIAFVELRTYEAGDRVLAQHFAHKRDGLICRDRMLVAWDAD